LFGIFLLSRCILIVDLKTRWVKIVLASQNVVIQTVRTFLFTSGGEKHKILIFRTGSIGDSVCAFPAFVAIREHYKYSQVDILTNAGGGNLVSLDKLLSIDYYDAFIDYSRQSFLVLWKIIKNKKYDLIIELPQDQVSLLTELRNMFFFRTAGIRSGWGWQVNTCFSFRQTQEKTRGFVSETNRLMTILKANGVLSKTAVVYPLNVQEEDFETARRNLKEAFSSYDHRGLVALVPGAKRPQNRYPLDRFVELAKWLVAKQYNVVVIGGPEDIERGARLAFSAEVISFCGKVSPIMSAALISHCKVCISNDTGPMHLAYAVGTPVIGLFSSRDFPNKWFPPQGNIALRNNHVHCSLCLSETCQNNICMQGIPIEEIKDAFIALEKTIRRA